MVTTDHIKGLSDKVDSLIVSDANRKGGTETAKWSVTQFVAWAVLLVAILTLIAMVADKDGIEQRLLHRQTQEEMR